MFTDSPATPARVEVLLSLVLEMRERKFDRSTIKNLLQPDGLPDLKSESSQASEALAAAIELGLVKEDGEKNFRPAWDTRRGLAVREVLVGALEDKVLGRTDVEPYFAPFYSFLIAQEIDVAGSGADGTKWAEAFNRARGDRSDRNPFNNVKYTGLRRWMRYSGLGWHDSKDNFIPCPYERIRRALPSVFGKSKKLDGVEFITRLGAHCPELDGGSVFAEINPKFDSGFCTRAVASVLRDMHDEDLLAINCPHDSRGPSLELAGEERDPKRGLSSDRIDSIELRLGR
jgi:hypothetical protein